MIASLASGPRIDSHKFSMDVEELIKEYTVKLLSDVIENVKKLNKIKTQL